MSAREIQTKVGGCDARGFAGMELLETRSLLSGSLDKSFSGDGLLTGGLPAGQFGGVSATVVQSDGKIIIAGSSGPTEGASGKKNYFVIRLNSNGTPDKSFNSTGTRLISRTAGDEPDLALTSDGHIVLASTNTLVKLTSSGKFDTSFGGGDGIASFSASGDKASLTLRPDGKLIVGVASVTNSNNVVRRFKSDGTLDKVFGSNGVADINAKTSLNHFTLETVLRQSDGNILVVGTEGSKIAVVRLQASGQLDASYGSSGVVTTAVHAGRTDNAVGGALQSNGQLVVAGNSFDAVHSKQGEFAIRYTTAGKPDKTFGTNGILSDDDISLPETASSIAIKSDGKIDIAGTAFKSGNPSFAVIQLKSNGSDDTGFGSNARAFASASKFFDEADSIAVAPGNKVVLGGFTPDGEDLLPEVARFT
jgi:uncharacterized delta-60 repeat protein